MLIEVGDPGRNLGLNMCFVAILALAWLYEVLMPSRFDIRVDLLLLLPMYTVVLIAAVVRWRSGRGAGTREGD